MTEGQQRLTSLANRWRKEADQYQRQVEEARERGTPSDQMLSLMTALRSCAIELEKVIPHVAPATPDPQHRTPSRLTQA